MRLGTKAMTLNIAEKVENDDRFAKSVVDAIKRFQHEDFGDLSEEDKHVNSEALTNGGMVMGAYGEEENRFWIIRDSDGKGSFVTTVLFPDEY